MVCGCGNVGLNGLGVGVYCVSLWGVVFIFDFGGVLIVVYGCNVWCDVVGGKGLDRWDNDN